MDIYYQEYGAKNRDRLATNLREWRARRPEYGKHWYAAHRKQEAEANRVWIARNPEAHRERVSRWAHTERGRATRRRWVQDNREARALMRHNRRARKLNNGGSYTTAEWQALCEQYGHRCLACGASVPLTVDHIVPISKGGSNDISNIQPLCMPCNLQKGVRAIDYRPKDDILALAREISASEGISLAQALEIARQEIGRLVAYARAWDRMAADAQRRPVFRVEAA